MGCGSSKSPPKETPITHDDESGRRRAVVGPLEPLTKLNLMALSMTTKMHSNTIQQLFLRFSECTGGLDSIRLEDFRKIVALGLPDGYEETQEDRIALMDTFEQVRMVDGMGKKKICAKFDENHDGLIQFDEFCVALSLHVDVEEDEVHFPKSEKDLGSLEHHEAAARIQRAFRKGTLKRGEKGNIRAEALLEEKEEKEKSSGDEKEEKEKSSGEEKEEKEKSSGEEKEEKEKSSGEEKEEKEKSSGDEKEEKEKSSGEDMGQLPGAIETE